MKTALLVIDVQNALVSANPYDIGTVLENIKRLIKACRESGTEVLYVQHEEDAGCELEPNTEGWQICPAITPQAGETVIAKRFNSAFRKTRLQEYLTSKSIEQLIITGMQTEYCIDTTIKVAFEYGYKLIFPQKTNTTFDNGNIKAEQLYRFYNFNIFKNRFGTVESVEETLKRIG